LLVDETTTCVVQVAARADRLTVPTGIGEEELRGLALATDAPAGRLAAADPDGHRPAAEAGQHRPA